MAFLGHAMKDMWLHRYHWNSHNYCIPVHHYSHTHPAPAHPALAQADFEAPETHSYFYCI